jgi:hypothetical protein
MTQAYNQTNYPKIFKDTHWGHLVLTFESDKEAIQNRDDFVKNQNIQKVVTTGKISTIVQNFAPGEYFDHVEVYKTFDNNIVILSSPYKEKDERYQQFLQDNGFTDTPELYLNGSVSFYKIFNKYDVTVSRLSKFLSSIKK